MTDRRDSRDPAAATSDSPVPWPGPTAMASLPAQPVTPRLPAHLASRALVYLLPAKIPAVLPHLDSRRSGLILAGDGTTKAMRALLGGGVSFPVLIDPEGYDRTATCEAPFSLPGSDGMFASTLDEVLDAQIQLGAAAALTPTGCIPVAGTDVLKAAISEFGELDRADSIFVAPLHISLLGRSYFSQTSAILASLGKPVALVLVCQGNPLDHSKDIIPNLRALAGRVPLMPIRTDFNGLDLLGWGAICTAIGTGGSVRHAVDPAEKNRAFKMGTAPSVLWPELLTYYKGSTIAEFFGAREHLAPACMCAACGGRRLTRFLRRDQQDEAIAHSIASWSPLAAQLLAATTVRERAEFWRNRCTDAIAQHQAVLDRLQRLDGLTLQPSLRRWAAVPASAPAHAT